ncbi:COBRA-like protein 10 [Nicotiana tabacum]|uniref:COBRA-like protein 10 n=1 Tax=Nicotiana tabacum TaxID=4097 RepID=A0A1S3ZGH8_TOBAC|nr:PREDICTED: COBRA-like protein 10 [Nicotiana tabacum]XP_016463449.1 PREDICTED: COBRA-like protein 10 [Nicotiana tabacum]
MVIKGKGMQIPWSAISWVALVLFFQTCNGQDYGGEEKPAAPPPEQEHCDGIFVTYSFEGRDKVYPLVKNISAQAWSFKSMLTVLNTGIYELKSWKVFVGFQHNELLVSADGAVAIDGDGFPVKVGKNGTTLAGYPQSDLKTAIDTAGDFTQMSAQISIKGTQFGLKDKATPMPKTIKLVNEGYKCPAPKRYTSYMHVCCTRDPKFKAKNVTTKFMPRRYGDLSIIYDVLSAYTNKYQAQVTIDNLNPLGRLDHWNLTWEWMRNEFIYSIKGAYTHKKDPSECIYGPQGQYYKDFDFTTVINCQKKPLISDLPKEKADDDKVGKLPYCCRNGTLLSPIMNETQARSIFQMEVFKLPPDLNRTALNPPQNWKIEGTINPSYQCGPPVRVDPSEFPDPNGIGIITTAVASWQITCNITRPKPKGAKCCVSFSAYYADSVIPCSTCACGCEQTSKCDANRKPLLLPPEALLVPFENREEKAKAWNDIKHFGPLPKKLPCPDNCGVSINWHVDSDYKSGWTARITLFNWGDDSFEDWFTAIQMKKDIASGYENVYSFNGTKLPNRNNTIFMQGLPGLNFLVGEVNGSNPNKDPRVPGKQQSVISFLKKYTPHINVAAGDGFPAKVFFNGEECALPPDLPSIASFKSKVGLLPAVLLALFTFLLLTDWLH